MSERLYSTFQVADLLGTTPPAVEEWIERGWLECRRFPDGPTRIPEAGLIEFLTRRGIDIEAVMARAVARAGRGGSGPAAADPPGGGPKYPSPSTGEGGPTCPGAADRRSGKGRESVGDADTPRETTALAPAASPPPALPPTPQPACPQPGEGVTGAHDMPAARLTSPKSNSAGMAPIPAADPPPPAAETPPPHGPGEVESPPDPTQQICQAILRDALARAATAIHLEHDPAGLTLRLRVDGVLHEKASFRHRLPKAAAPALIEAFKVRAGLDPAPTHRPQAGQFDQIIDGRDIHFRLCTSPMVHGERVVIHLLDPARGLPGLADLGMDAAAEARIRELLSETCGIVLLAAPARRERLLTLRAMAKALPGRERNVIVLPASPPQAIEAVNQFPLGCDPVLAAEALAGQDPDVLIVEEAADPAVAAAIVDLAAEGCLALAGLPARSAADALAAFRDLARRPGVLSMTLLAVIEQRTVRRLCPACRTPATPDPRLLEKWGLAPQPFLLYGPGGCARCANTGYAGPAVLAGITPVGPPLARSIRRPARRLGTAPPHPPSPALAAAALAALREHATSLEEIARVLPAPHGPAARSQARPDS